MNYDKEVISQDMDRSRDFKFTSHNVTYKINYELQDIKQNEEQTSFKIMKDLLTNNIFAYELIELQNTNLVFSSDLINDLEVKNNTISFPQGEMCYRKEGIWVSCDSINIFDNEFFIKNKDDKYILLMIRRDDAYLVIRFRFDKYVIRTSQFVLNFDNNFIRAEFKPDVKGSIDLNYSGYKKSLTPTNNTCFISSIPMSIDFNFKNNAYAEYRVSVRGFENKKRVLNKTISRKIKLKN